MNRGRSEREQLAADSVNRSNSLAIAIDLRRPKAFLESVITGGSAKESGPAISIEGNGVSANWGRVGSKATSSNLLAALPVSNLHLFSGLPNDDEAFRRSNMFSSRIGRATNWTL